MVTDDGVGHRNDCCTLAEDAERRGASRPLSMAAACEGVAFSMPVRFIRLKGAVPMAYIPFSLEEGPTK